MLVFLAAAALAVPSYPGLLQDDVGMPCMPACTVCHTSPSGGNGTITQPFGKELVRRGLVADDPASLQAALDALLADGVDSDGDGVGDVDELVDGSDPNGGADFCSLPDARYGCFNHVPAPLGTGGLAIAAGAMLLRARRR